MLQNCLYIASDLGYIAEDEFHQTYRHCERVRQIIERTDRRNLKKKKT